MITPAPYSSGSSILGHYRVAQRSGEIAATLAAAAHLARIRWAPGASTPFLILKKIKVGYSISAAVTAAVELAFRAIKVTGFTVDFTTNMTTINMSTGLKTNADRPDFMSASTMGANGPGICTTAALSGQTMTADNAPFAMATMTAAAPGVAAVNWVVGVTGQMTTLYEWQGNGDFPIFLGNNEGVIIQNQLTGPASGTFALYVVWEWLESPFAPF